MEPSARIVGPLALSSLSVLALTLSVPAAHAAPTHYHLVRTVHLPGAGGWDYLFADGAAHRLYVSRGTHIAVVDTATGKLAGDITDTAGVHGVAIDPKSGRGFTSNGQSNSVTIFDTRTLKKIGEVPVGEGPDAIVFEPVTGRVFTFNGRAGTATAIDAAKGTVVGTVTLPGRPEYPVADGRGHLFDNIEDKSEIADVNARTLAVDHVWPIAPGESPSGMAMDTKGRRLFSVCDGQKMIVTDADTGKVVATPTIGNGPDACSYDPARRLVFCPNGQDGTMTVLHEDTPDVYTPVQTLKTQAGARTMTLDERTHHVFTVSATALPAAPGAPRWRRSYAPDSFVVLEYAP